MTRPRGSRGRAASVRCRASCRWPKSICARESRASGGAPQRTRRVRALRLKALLEVLYATGMRVSELVGLPRSVLDGDDRMLTIRGKGGRERMVPLNATAREAIGRYLAIGAGGDDDGSRLPSAKYLFPSRGAEGHLTRQRLGQELKELAGEAGLEPERVSPARAPARVCQSYGRSGRRPESGSATAGARRYLYNPDLHSCAGGAAQAACARAPSARQVETDGQLGW